MTYGRSIYGAGVAVTTNTTKTSIRVMMMLMSSSTATNSRMVDEGSFVNFPQLLQQVLCPSVRTQPGGHE
jgi:hypothetical protein